MQHVQSSVCIGADDAFGCQILLTSAALSGMGASKTLICSGSWILPKREACRVISTSRVPLAGMTPEVGAVVKLAKPWLRDSCPMTSHLQGSLELFVRVKTRWYGCLHDKQALKRPVSAAWLHHLARFKLL